jgi:hypothetical protein
MIMNEVSRRVWSEIGKGYCHAQEMRWYLSLGSCAMCS